MRHAFEAFLADTGEACVYTRRGACPHDASVLGTSAIGHATHYLETKSRPGARQGRTHALSEPIIRSNAQGGLSILQAMHSDGGIMRGHARRDSPVSMQSISHALRVMM